MTSSQEQFGQFQPNSVGYMPGERRGQNKENFDKSLKIFSDMYHWTECIDIWHGVS